MSPHTPIRGDNAAEDLVGQTLSGRWTVLERIDPRPGDTGGNFSVNYIVENQNGHKAFCKVLNYGWILDAVKQGHDLLELMAYATAIYKFERDLARECVGLSRIVTAIDDGSFIVEGYAQPHVSYIIFEAADDNIRRLLDTTSHLDIATRLRSLHHLATGLRQLHGRNVAHQDVKPSNALVFHPSIDGTRITKLGDLGRATVLGRPIYHDDYTIAGDPAYAPPEGLYHAAPDGFGPRRLACDLYQLGGMISFVFTSAPFNALLQLELHPTHNWQNWNGTYSEVMPYLRDAFGRAVARVRGDLPSSIRDQVAKLLEQLCEPDPLRRGHPRTRELPGNQYALDRVVTEFDLLSRRAEYQLRILS